MLVLLACDGGEDPDDTENDGNGESSDDEICAYTGAFTGAVEADVALGDDEGCSGSGYDDRLAMSFGIISQEGYWVSIEIGSGAPAGQTGTGLPAAVTVIDYSVDEYNGWRTGDSGCTVDITEMSDEDDFFDWIVSGEGSCTEPATAENTDVVTGEVTVGEFSFTAPASWPD